MWVNAAIIVPQYIYFFFLSIHLIVTHIFLMSLRNLSNLFAVIVRLSLICNLLWIYHIFCPPSLIVISLGSWRWMWMWWWVVAGCCVFEQRITDNFWFKWNCPILSDWYILADYQCCLTAIATFSYHSTC